MKMHLVYLACGVLVVVFCAYSQPTGTSNDRISRLERLVQKQSQEITSLKKEINNQRISDKEKGLSYNKKRLLLTESPPTLNSKVAFYAYLSKSEIDPGHHHIIVFDHVQTNVGYGYNKHSGTFIAPEEGVYIFAYSVVAYAGSRMPVELVVNSNVVASTAADSTSDTPYPAASNTVALHLNQGDTCFLRTSPNNGWVVGNIHSSNWSRSSFTGWKL